MPISAQRRARRLPFWWTIDMTGMVASHAAMVVMVPALAEDGDIIKQRTFALRIAYRGVLTDTLPVRTALGPYPTRAFDLSSGPVMSVLSDGELSTSHAWLNNPTARGLAQSPQKWGVSGCVSATAPDDRRRDSLLAQVGAVGATPRALNVALSQRTLQEQVRRLFNGFVLRPPAGTLFSLAILKRDPDASQPDRICRASAADSFACQLLDSAH